MSSPEAAPPRFCSWLFAPSTNPRHVAKALAGPADAVILDLEDAVAISEKPAARHKAKSVIAGCGGRKPIFVRINDFSTEFALEDLQAVVVPGLQGVMVPKVQTTADIAIASWLITQFERASGLAEGSVEIVPLLETAAGLAQIRAIATGSPRVRRMALGAGDLTLDLGLTWSRDELELLPYRTSMVLESRACGLLPPIDAAWISITDTDAMAASALRSRDHGFHGKLCIHPTQVDQVNRAFMPGPAEIAHAQDIIEQFEAAEASGVAALKVNGQMVDYPVVTRAREILAFAARCAD